LTKADRSVRFKALALCGAWGLLLWIVYFFVPGNLPHTATGPYVIRDVVAFAISFLGAPIANIVPSMALPAGLLSAVLALAYLVRCYKEKTLGPEQSVSAAVCIFILAIAAAAGIGRDNLGLAGATESRFATPALVLWVALLIAYWPRVVRTKIGWLATPCVAVFGLLSHAWYPYDYTALPSIKSNAETAILAGVKDAKMLSPIGSVDRIWNLRPFVLRNGLSPFSGRAAQPIGRQLEEVSEGVVESCRGHLDTSEPVAGNKGHRVSGWAVLSDGTTPDFVLLVQQGAVTGLGRFVVNRPDVLASNNGAKTSMVGFAGYVKEMGSPVQGYLLIRGFVCRLAGEIR
jgi:hypothetical protein